MSLTPCTDASPGVAEFDYRAAHERPNNPVELGDTRAAGVYESASRSSRQRQAAGQPFLVFEITAFEIGRHLSGIIRPPFDRLFGPLAGTYAVTPRGPHASRLVVKLTMGADGRWQRIRCTALAWGDLIMMRKQLLTLETLAEASSSATMP